MITWTAVMLAFKRLASAGAEGPARRAALFASCCAAVFIPGIFYFGGKGKKFPLSEAYNFFPPKSL